MKRKKRSIITESFLFEIYSRNYYKNHKSTYTLLQMCKKSEIWLGLKDVVSFGDGEFLTDLRIALVDCLKNLSLTLVNSLKTLASEHVYLLC